ncbi:UNVERIFIED_CONTAM: hypothetical protein HDU68_009915 [Siphonaria sp. JEL0065]|nr:hypothetical protein HDU68_009915 [Siphonaria sp. JEL0065]
MPKDLGGFLMGETSLATIYNYGLPLSDGLIGGFSAFPLAAPSHVFNIEGLGIVYAYSVICGGPIPVPPSTTKPPLKPDSISFELLDSVLGLDNYTATISVTLAANSHDAINLTGQAITQHCSLVYMMGEGVIKFQFVSDEWEMVTGGLIQEIDLGKLVVKQKMASEYKFQDVVGPMGPLKENKMVVGWVADALKATLNQTQFTPMENGIVSTLFQWGRGGDMKAGYSVNQTWMALGGAVGVLSHYILMQYEAGITGKCAFSGLQDAGVIDMPENATEIIVTTTSICLMMHLIGPNSQLPIITSPPYERNVDLHPRH